MGRTTCTEPQCLYKGALYLTFYIMKTWTELCQISYVQHMYINLTNDNKLSTRGQTFAKLKIKCKSWGRQFLLFKRRIIDQLICDWVRDHTVLTHLVLNLWAICGSPVALLKFQMAPRLILFMSLDPRRRSPDIHVWVRPKPRTHKPLLHTSYTMDCLTAPFGEDISSGYYVQWGQ
jgi:hypothetical protein